MKLSFLLSRSKVTRLGMMKGSSPHQHQPTWHYLSNSSAKLIPNITRKRSHGRAQQALWPLLGALFLVRGSTVVDLHTAALEGEPDEVSRSDDDDPEDFDCYIHSPTVDDLPLLLSKFEDDGLDVWPWVWIHANENGPHHVFVGINDHVLKRLVELRTESCQNNLLLIVQDEKDVAGYGEILQESHCGVIVGTIELLHPRDRILMLEDERIIVFDTLTMV